jgi:hypothetical protein
MHFTRERRIRALMEQIQRYDKGRTLCGKSAGNTAVAGGKWHWAVDLADLRAVKIRHSPARVGKSFTAARFDCKEAEEVVNLAIGNGYKGKCNKARVAAQPELEDVLIAGLHRAVSIRISFQR